MLHGRQAFRAKIRNMAPTAETDVADLKSFVAVATKYSNDFHDPETRGARSRFLAYASPEVRTAYWQMIADDTALGLTLVRQAITLWMQYNKLAGKMGHPYDPDDLLSKVKELHELVLKRDNELAGLIRRELGSDPPPKPTPPIWHGLMAPSHAPSQNSRTSLLPVTLRLPSLVPRLDQRPPADDGHDQPFTPQDVQCPAGGASRHAVLLLELALARHQVTRPVASTPYPVYG